MKKARAFSWFGIMLMSCTRGYEPIEYGKDVCAHCKMTIMDSRYAAECITKKGKAFKFDDVICMRKFSSERLNNEIDLLFAEGYLRTDANPLYAEKAVYLQHDFFGSPMNGRCAAFQNEEEARRLSDSLKIKILRWEDIK